MTKTGDALAWQIIDGAERFATHDPRVQWPDGPYDNAVDAICAALDSEGERIGGDYKAKALAELAKADEVSNRDHMEAGFRAHMIEWHFRHAQIYATLACARG